MVLASEDIDGCRIRGNGSWERVVIGEACELCWLVNIISSIAFKTVAIRTASRRRLGLLLLYAQRRLIRWTIAG
jgi:hypothetical protein